MFISIIIWISFTLSFSLGGDIIRIPIVDTIPAGNIVKNTNDDLNLTCRVNSNASPRYDISWSLPIKKSSKNENPRVSIYKQHTELTVTIHQLEESDSGQYACVVTGHDINLKSSVTVTVKSGTQPYSCPEAFFRCTNMQCIPKRYLCDGYEDCSDGKDETPQICGVNVCKGKIHCDDGRCLAPELCCDPLENIDCRPYLVPCCQKTVSTSNGESLNPTSKNHSRDISFMQSTVYTIISCIIAFIFITLIMIIGFCRFHMKRSAMLLTANSQMRPDYQNRSDSQRATISRRLFYWPWRSLRTNRSQDSRRSEGDEERASGESLCSSQLPHPYPCSISSTGSFIIKYNGPNGIQIVERLPKPPPYSEAPFAPEDDYVMGPPPLYRSVESIGNHGGQNV